MFRSAMRAASGVMLNLLRDAARLEGRGCLFLHSCDVEGLREAAAHLGEGAVVYVDDFAGSGEQFCGVRDFVAELIPRNFQSSTCFHAFAVRHAPSWIAVASFH